MPRLRSANLLWEVFFAGRTGNPRACPRATPHDSARVSTSCVCTRLRRTTVRRNATKPRPLRFASLGQFELAERERALAFQERQKATFARRRTDDEFRDS